MQKLILGPVSAGAAARACPACGYKTIPMRSNRAGKAGMPQSMHAVLQLPCMHGTRAFSSMALASSKHEPF